MAELLARLRTREIERERRERRSYDDAMVRWRTLRTERSVSLFVDLIESDHMSDNAARLEITRELAEDQTKARDSLVTHIDAFKKLLPDEDADVDPGELNPRSVKAWAKGTYIFISHMGVGLTDDVFCVQVCSRGATRGTARWRSGFDAWRSSRPNCMWRRHTRWRRYAARWMSTPVR